MSVRVQLALDDARRLLGRYHFASGTVTEVARQWVLSDVAANVERGTVDGPFILPLLGQTSVMDYRTVVRVTVPAQKPVGRWEVFVDANTGERVARQQTLMFGTGTVLYNAPMRYPGSDRADYPADSAGLTVNGESATTDIAGSVSWTGDAAADVTVQARGTFARVNNDGGSAHTAGTPTASSGPNGRDRA